MRKGSARLWWKVRRRGKGGEGGGGGHGEAVRYHHARSDSLSGICSGERNAPGAGFCGGVLTVTHAALSPCFPFDGVGRDHTLSMMVMTVLTFII